ncbi:glycosyltransferase [Allokutzneria sp. A3M-2-11 16]|uniref:glycosyltransferase n=1 Tax=Allokutzneria sp. A3M-2-11 16 TaxID=2962043 RepID=UPI0020B81F18|nr:glycosyltransferase [Allokutzneria sp. A3M-2-11 16]MCP3803263.1 glycosyltransferase [Allokutzneria sp. A3M-2-11 16]
MARILVTSLPFAGHVGAIAPLAHELAGRGHEVVTHTGAKYRERFPGEWLPWTEATDFDDADLAATFPSVGNGKGARGGFENSKHVLFGTGAGQARDIVAAARRRPFDLIVGDHLAFGTALAGELLGIPWATVAVTPLSYSSGDLPPPGMPLSPARGAAGRVRDAVLRPVARAAYRRLADPMINRMRAAVGLGPTLVGGGLEGFYSPHLVVAQGVPGLDYTRSDLPPHVHFVGRLASPGSGGELPPEVTSSKVPVVHVTQGTLDVDPADLLKPAIAGLADKPVFVVCTSPSTLGPLPPNVIASPFLPHSELLPFVDVMVTNGGWGGVLAAVSSGVPLVVAGGSLDKPEVARRVAWSGAGVNLRTGRPSARAVSQAVTSVLADKGFRARAGELGSLLSAAGGVQRAGVLVESLLGTSVGSA